MSATQFYTCSNSTVTCRYYSSVPHLRVALSLQMRTNGATTTGFSTDNLHELNGGPTSPYGYDLNGNQTSTNGCTYGHDGADQLTSITCVATYQTLMTYDGLGRLRIRQDNTWNGSSWVMSAQTCYLCDGMRVIQDRDGSNTPQVSYTRGADLSAGQAGLVGGLESAGGIGGLLARSSGYSGVSGSWSTHYDYHSDGNGNVTCLISASQAVSAAYRYDPFGNVFASSGGLASANVYRFSSKMIDRNAGTYYYGYRHYDPNLQRWLNRDPIGERGGINLFTFVVNNPVTFLDPDGLLMDAPEAGGRWSLATPFQAGRPSCIDACVMQHILGISVSSTVVVSSQPLSKKRFVSKGSVEGTSLVGRLAGAVIGDARTATRLPTLVGFCKLRWTKSVSRFVSRWVPFVGWDG